MIDLGIRLGQRVKKVGMRNWKLVTIQRHKDMLSEDTNFSFCIQFGSAT